MKKIIFLLFVFAASARASQIVINGGFDFTPTNLDITAQGGGRDKIGTLGPAGGMQALYDVNPHLALGLDLNYADLHADRTRALLPILDATMASHSLVALAAVKYTFLPNQRVIPYFLAGIGLHHSAFHFETRPVQGLVWPDTGTTESRSVAQGSSTNYAALLGAGFDIPISASVFLGAESRFQILGPVHFPVNGVFQSYGVQEVGGIELLVTTLLHVGYRF